jgi:uncharacterized membrane protein
MHASHKQRLSQLQASRDQSDMAVAAHMAERQSIARSHRSTIPPPTPGQAAADAVAAFGGSWTFIGLFALTLIGWVALNSFVLVRHGATAFDPYPYILLNLFLSMLASIQAPVILMSQNRQGEKDRINAQHDYEVNLKAELEIMALHEKIDALAVHQWDALIALQREQLQLLEQLARKAG